MKSSPSIWRYVVKFIYSKKATKFLPVPVKKGGDFAKFLLPSQNIWTLIIKSTVKSLSIFVAFYENMNFIFQWHIHSKRQAINAYNANLSQVHTWFFRYSFFSFKTKLGWLSLLRWDLWHLKLQLPSFLLLKTGKQTGKQGSCHKELMCIMWTEVETALLFCTQVRIFKYLFRWLFITYE